MYSIFLHGNALCFLSAKGKVSQTKWAFKQWRHGTPEEHNKLKQFPLPLHLLKLFLVSIYTMPSTALSFVFVSQHNFNAFYK